MDIDTFCDNWKTKYFAPVKRDKKWATLKWHICKAGEPVNPISYAKGGEIQVEQFGIIGWLYEVDDLGSGKGSFYQCPLIEARETGTGKFGEWLVSVKKFVREKYKAEFALCTITNEHLYKYCERHDIPVAVNQCLYRVKTRKK